MPAHDQLPALPPLVSDEELARLRVLVEASRPAYLADLQRLVDIDCGSYTKAGVDEVGQFVRASLRELGGEVAVHRSERLGDTVVGVLRGDGAARALLIGHMDTVFDPGTAAKRPFRIEGGRAFGPGVTDMKGGLLGGLYALAALRGLAAVGADEGVDASTWLPFGRLVFVANPDEEIGSPESTSVIREAATGCDLALVLECARANGDIVSARKGTVDLRLTLRGRAAHAGVEPEKGRSAILEAAHKTVALQALNGRRPGVTCNVGVIRAGTRPNVVAETAILEVDLRAATRGDLEDAEAAVRAIAAATTVPDVTCEVAEAGRHWPMEKLPASVRLVDHAHRLAGRLGFTAQDCATGGASDANTTAGMGVPSLDGLGPIGGLDHAPGEYLELDSIVPRITLLAALLLTTARDPAFAPRR
ncbi:MAG: M20 family metallopeptidase [Candidatus Limnocylindrales bacterium]